MAINDIVNKNGSLNYSTIGGFKDRLDGHDGQLAERETIDGFSGANDTAKFYNACQYAIANGKMILLTRNITLDASIYNQFEIPSIEGNNFTITVNGSLHLYVGSSCLFIRNLQIIDTNNYAMSDFSGTNKSQYDKGYLFETKSGFTINGFSTSNIKFNGTSACSTGTYRTKGVFYLIGSNITFRDMSISAGRAGIRINDPLGVSGTMTYNVTFDNVQFTNQEQGIWINNVLGIYINGVSLTNTATQQSNYSCLQGADLYNFLYCSDIQIYKTYSNYAIERTVYFIQTNNIVLDGFIIENAGGGNGGGVKFDGLITLSGIKYPATNIKVNNGIFTGNGRSYAIECYTTQDVEITNIVVNASSGMYDYFLGLSQNNTNTYIDNCTVYNLSTYFIYGVLLTSDPNSAGINWTHLYRTLKITNCRIINPVNPSATTVRTLIGIYNANSQDLTNRSFFTFDDFTFKDNTVIQTLASSTWVASTSYSVGNLVTPTTANGYVYKCTTAGTSGSTQPTWPVSLGGTVTDGTAVWTCQDPLAVNPIETTSKLLTLIDNSYPINGMRYENNFIRGCSTVLGFLSVNSLSRNVNIKGDYYVNYSNVAPYSSALYCSYPSDIRFLVADTNGLYETRARYNNINTLTQCISNNTAELLLQYSPAASEVKIFFQTNNGARLYSGFGEIFFTDGTYCRFSVTNSSGNLTMNLINGSGTLSSNQINFSNGSDLEFGPTYKELRVRSGATPVAYTVKWNATV